MPTHSLRSPRTRVGAGFTIIEVIVVVVVIAVLASITVVSYNGAQAKSRDAARMDNLKAISDALALYLLDNGRYPAIQDGAGTESSCGSQTENWGHCDRMKALSDALAPYMEIDPVSLSTVTTGSSYYYYYNSAGTDNYAHYGIMVYLEGTGGQGDGGYAANAYELGDSPVYCMNKYTGTDAYWRYSAINARCQGGN